MGSVLNCELDSAAPKVLRYILNHYCDAFGQHGSLIWTRKSNDFVLFNRTAGLGGTGQRIAVPNILLKQAIERHTDHTEYTDCALTQWTKTILE